jgi:hypothetical protein
MKLKTVFIAHAVTEVIFGLGFLLAPGVLLGFLGTSTDATGLALSHIAGAVILSLAIISWLARDVPAGTLRDAMVWSFVLAHGAAGTVVALAVWAGTFNWLGWPAAALDAFFVLTFLWLRRQG